MPGPSSTQTLVAIGHKVCGPFLALLTMLVWALPVLSVMTLLSFMGQLLFNYNISEDAFRYIGPMAVGFIIVAAWRIGSKVVKDRLTFYLLVFGAIVTYVIREPWIFPLVLLIGGAVSIFNSKEKELWNPVKSNPPLLYLVAFAIFLPGLLLIYFIYPIWENLKKIKGIKVSLNGVTAVAGGLIVNSIGSYNRRIYIKGDKNGT